MKKPIITSVQLLMLAVGSALVFPYTFMPILNAPHSNQDIWIVLLLALVYMLIINAPMLYLLNKFRGLTFNQATDTILGKCLGKPVVMLYVLMFFFYYIASSLITVHFMSSFLFPGTPRWVLLLFLVVPVCYAAYKGAGTIGRLSVFIVPFVILTILLFLLFGMTNMDFSVFLPVLADSTFVNLNVSAFLTAARFSEILIFFVFSYYLDNKVSINKTYVTSVAVFGVCFLLIVVPTVAGLGVDFARMSWNPYYVYTRQVNAFSFLERVQALNTLAWFPSTILSLSIYNFMACRMMSVMFKTKSHKKFVIPFTAVGFFACLLPVLSNTGTMKLLTSYDVYPYVILVFIFVLPCIMAAVYLMRKRKLEPVIKKLQSSKKAAEE